MKFEIRRKMSRFYEHPTSNGEWGPEKGLLLKYDGLVKSLQGRHSHERGSPEVIYDFSRIHKIFNIRSFHSMFNVGRSMFDVHRLKNLGFQINSNLRDELSK